jgi:hypothetical protein
MEELRAIVATGDGYVFNTDGRKLHRASCEWVRGMGLGTPKFALGADEDATAFLAGRGGRPCPNCLGAQPRATSLPTVSGQSTPSADEGQSAHAPRVASAGPAQASRAAVVDGAGGVEFAVLDRTVSAWATEYVPLSPKTPTAVALKAGLIAVLRNLGAQDGKSLHAVFAGEKPPTADIENLLLYNLGSSTFANLAVHGLRIERDHRPPEPAPSGTRYPYSFSYRPTTMSSPWTLWQRRRELVRWERISLGAFSGEKKLEQVWAALSGAALGPSGPPRGPGEDFAVTVIIHPPADAAAHPARLVKGVVDGVVSAFQSHADSATRPEVARRIALVLDETPEQIEAWLADEHVAVLGVVPSIVHVRAEGVQWSPTDTDLVVADIRPGPSLGEDWALSGAIHTAAPVI